MNTIANETEFEKTVLKSDLPVLVEFFAPWCNTCGMLTPVIENIAAEAAGDFAVCKVDIDTIPSLAARYGIGSVPTVIVFKNGRESARHLGVADRKTLLGYLR